MTNPMPLSPLEAELRRRLRRIDPTTDAGNGQLLADAAATLIAADAMQAEVEPQAVARLTDAELAAAMPVVAVLIGYRTVCDIALPFGTKAKGIDPGYVIVGDQHYVMVDVWGGMTRAHEAPTSQAGPNLNRFLEELRQATAGLECSALGLPQATTDGARVPEHLLHFPPCAAAGGVSLDVPIDRPIYQLPHDAFDDIIQLTVWAMEIFWSQRKALARRVNSARSIFQAEAALVGPTGAGLTIADFRSRPFEFVDSNCETLHEKLSLYIGLASFNAALRPGVGHWLMIGKVRAKRTMAHAVKAHLRKLHSVAWGPSLFIDGLAASVANAAPGGAAAVLHQLSRDLAATVALPIPRTRQLVVRLGWTNGIIRAWSYGTRHVSFRDTEVTLRDYPLPETIENALTGRRLDEIVELPMPCALKIREVERVGATLRILHLNDVLYSVDLAAGTIGEELPF